MTHPDPDLLILVDSEDRAVGALDKERCHDGQGRLHRAFSVLLFDEAGRLLLQRRSARKRLWPGVWSNSVCSHPRVGEEAPTAAHRRVQEELGLHPCPPLTFVYRFEYHATDGERGSEHELCSVFLGRLPAALVGEISVDTEEIEALDWVSPVSVTELVRDAAACLSPWFRLEWQELSSRHEALLSAFATPTSAER